MATGWRGVAAGALALVAFEQLVQPGASGRLSGLFALPGGWAHKFLDPTVPAFHIPSGKQAPPPAFMQPGPGQVKPPTEQGSPPGAWKGGADGPGPFAPQPAPPPVTQDNYSTAPGWASGGPTAGGMLV